MGRPALSDAEIDARRDSVLTCALAQSAAGGATAITVRGIAKELDLSPMALYRYFPGGRDGILATLRGRGFERLAAHLERAIRGVDEPVQRIVALVTGGVAYACSEPDLYRLMYEVTQSDDHLGVLADKRQKAWKVVSDAFSNAVDAAGAIHGNPEMLPHIFFAAAHGAIMQEFSRQPYSERRVRRLLAPMLTVLLRGAGADEAALAEIPTYIKRAHARLDQTGEAP